MIHARPVFTALRVWGIIMTGPRRLRAQETGSLNLTVRVDGVEYRYQVYVPANWSKELRRRR